jgi:DNA polymerase III epsilon subunit-like protein
MAVSNRAGAGERSGDGIQLALPEPDDDTRTYAVFDLETTGLDPKVEHVIEIGWCIVREGRAEQVRSVLVTAPVAVPPVVERLTGITSAMLEAEGVALPDALAEFFADTHGLPLVGHNVVRFDALFLESACRRAALAAPSRLRYRDTAAQFKAHRLGLSRRGNQTHWDFAMDALSRPAPGLRYALAVCCEKFAISLEGVAQHRAAADVMLTQQLYVRLNAAVASPVESVRTIPAR